MSMPASPLSKAASFLRKIWHGLADPREDGPAFALATAGLFCVGLSIVHYNHELWRDEIHCWSVGRNADGLWDLLTGIRRYDGHPFLWYYLLHLVSLWSRSQVYLHVVTVVLATVSAYLWLRHANLPRVLRLMLLGTYCFFFEYSVISRSYALGVLLAFCSAACTTHDSCVSFACSWCWCCCRSPVSTDAFWRPGWGRFSSGNPSPS